MYQPVVIIGAARSGTNMLRDLLVQLPRVATWDCDEINYIWRHGNAAHPHDEFGPELARPLVQKYIRRAFDRLAQQNGCRYVVEKTCANSLRVGFVNRIVPTAKYVFLTRDGRDVVASARKRWVAPLDLKYIAKKACYVPKADLVYYGTRYLANRLHRLVSGSKRLAFWGPQFVGIEELLAKHSLEQVCAAQWARSVQRSIDDFEAIDPSRVHRVQYEQFTTQPSSELRRLVNFLGLDVEQSTLETLSKKVGKQSVGNWQRELPQEIAESIQPFLAEQLAACGYSSQGGKSLVDERRAAA